MSNADHSHAGSSCEQPSRCRRWQRRGLEKHAHGPTHPSVAIEKKRANLASNTFFIGDSDEGGEREPDPECFSDEGANEHVDIFVAYETEAFLAPSAAGDGRDEGGADDAQLGECANDDINGIARLADEGSTLTLENALDKSPAILCKLAL